MKILNITIKGRRQTDEHSIEIEKNGKYILTIDGSPQEFVKLEEVQTRISRCLNAWSTRYLFYSRLINDAIIQTTTERRQT